MAGTELAVSTVNHHLAATCNHITTDIVNIRTCYIARASYHNIVGRIHAIAAGSVSSEKIVPAVTVGNGGSFAVNGNIDRLVSFDTCSGRRIKLHHPDKPEICSVGTPQTPCHRIHEKAGINSIAVFIHLGRSYLDRLCKLEVRRRWIKSLVPHREDSSGMTATQSSACRAISHEIFITYFQSIRSSSPTGTLRTRIPVPAILGYESAATGSECIILSFTFHNGRRVVDPRFSLLSQCRN